MGSFTTFRPARTRSRSGVRPVALGRTATTVSGSTKRARSSTCPCVSSPAMPFLSQMTRVGAQIIAQTALDLARG